MAVRKRSYGAAAKRSAAKKASGGAIKQPAPEELARVVANAQLHQVILVASYFERSVQLDPRDLQMGFNREITSHAFSGDVAGTRFEWSAFAAEGSSEKHVLTCMTEWLVQYTNLEGCDEAAVFEFTQRHGTMTSYPYFRGYAAGVFWTAGFQVPPMPIITAGSIASISLDALRKIPKKKIRDRARSLK